MASEINITIYRNTDFDAIPEEPGTTSFWALNQEVLLVYSLTLKSFYLLHVPKGATKRSLRLYSTKHEARADLESGNMEWILPQDVGGRLI